MMAAANNPANQKMRNLPLLCVESICKFTPTSKLVRLCSIALPLPGACWLPGLEAVLKKRLPLSLRDDNQFRHIHAKSLYDVSGAKVASIHSPGSFRFSAIREFVESATLQVMIVRPGSTDAPMQFHLVLDDALLPHLSTVFHLELEVLDTDVRSEWKGPLEPRLKRFLPQLQSFFISYYLSDVRRRQVSEAFGHFIAVRVAEMKCLRRLALPVTGFESLMRAAADRLSDRLQAVLAGLTSLVIERRGYYDVSYYGSAERPFVSALKFVALNCRQLSQLKVDVRGRFSAYLAAFRAFPCLTSLALDVYEANLTGLTFDGRDAIGSVKHLRIMFGPFDFDYHCSPASTGDILKIATLFPSVLAVEVKADSLELATSLFGQKKLFPAVAQLRCLNEFPLYVRASAHLTQFLANPRLPEAVDLSRIIFSDMSHDADLLKVIYCAMQSSSVKSLLLSGPVLRKALPRLRSHIDFNGENSTKVFAWKDRDFGDQPGANFPALISEQTDFKVVGRKTSGNLKDEEFTIRVFHQLAKRGTGSWYFSMK